MADETSKISEYYVSMLLMWADKQPAFFIHCYENFPEGIDGKNFLTKDQKDALTAKYEELTA